MSEDTDSTTILICAGGTGGHIFPAAALGRDLLSRGYDVHVATDERGLKYDHAFQDMTVHKLPSGTFAGTIIRKIRGAFALGLGYIQAGRLLDRIKPAVVIGFGGYPSVPGVYAAQRRRLPTVIHEQNAIIGRANQFLAPRTDRIALSMAQAEGLDETDAVRAVVTGNPVRSEIADLYTKPYPALKQDGPLNIFVMGGSQGASIFSEVVPATLAKLPESYKKRLHIVQQCREADLESARTTYEQAGIEARLAPFFDDVPALLTAAHLVIARSGASTVAEVTTAGRPAIFVPYPHHADQQQKINAEAVADAGGAWVMTQNGFTAEALLARIETFMQNPETLFRAAESARNCGRPDAARRLGNLVTALASGWDKKEQKPFDLTQGREDVV